MPMSQGHVVLAVGHSSCASPQLLMSMNVLYIHIRLEANPALSFGGIRTAAYSSSHQQFGRLRNPLFRVPV